jgi:hypothetical protein
MTKDGPIDFAQSWSVYILKKFQLDLWQREKGG